MSSRKAAAILLCLALCGCAAVKSAEAPRVMRAAPVFTPATPGTLVTSVAPVMARGTAAERRYAYIDRAAPREVLQAATLFWEEPPPRIVERALVDGLRALVGPAAGSDTTVNADQRVIARLERFEEVTGGSLPAEAAVAIDVTVMNAERHIRLTGRYCGSAPVASGEPSERATAFEAALRQAVEALARDMRSGAGHASTPC